MSTLDRAALIEQAAAAEWRACWGIPWEPEDNEEWISITAAALPVIAKALLAPLQELEGRSGFWEEDNHGASSPERRYGSWIEVSELALLLDAIEAEVQP